MSQYEYKTLDFTCALHSALTGLPQERSAEWEDQMDELGEEGWQLVSIISPSFVIFGMSMIVRCIFIRAKNLHSN